MKHSAIWAAVLLGSTLLVGCDSEPDSAPDINIEINNPPPTGGGDGDGDGGGDEPTITNTPLPILEDFIAANIEAFFDAAYRALASEAEPGEDNFYFSLAGVYMDDGTVDPEGGNWITADDDQAMRLGNARFTIGQTVSSLAGEVTEPRKNSTPGDGVDEGLSWGELDLSEPYRISFCVVAATEGPTSSLMQVYADNNTTSEASSIHGGGNSGSRIFNQPVNTLIPGSRVEINIPGDTTLTSGGELVASKPDHVGTENSFFSFRVSSGGWVVFDDLVIESQSDSNGASQPDCAAKTTDYTVVNPATGGSDSTAPEPEHLGTPFAGLPLMLDFSADAETFFGENTEADFLALSTNPASPFYAVTSGSSRITIENNALSMNNARFTIGDSGAPSAEGVEPAGDIDLSRPYRISMTVTDFTSADPADPGKFQVYIDNNTSSSGNSIHGGDSKESEVTPEELGELPAMLVLEPEIGTATSFIQIRADSRVGNLTLQDVTIEYLDEPTDPGAAWNGQVLTLAGSADLPPTGSVSVNTDTAVTLTAMGGNVSSSNHQLFFAHQHVDMGEFTFTARIGSVTGADMGVGNSYRFGLMIMENLTPVGDVYADLAGWADVGMYADGDPVALIGSRGQMKPSGSRSRSNIDELEVGDYVRIEIYNDEDNTKRLKRYYSKDGGMTFEQANSTSDFKATHDSTSWFVGFYGAPGDNEVTVEFDDIDIAPYVAPVE